MRIVTLVLAVSLLMPAVAGAQNQPIREAAERLAEDVVTEPARQRSMFRTITGFGMVATGITMLLFDPRSEGSAFSDPFIEPINSSAITKDAETVESFAFSGSFEPEPFYSRSRWLRYGGAALVIGGTAISTFWSDVPVLRDVQVAPTRHGMVIGSSIGF